MLFMKLNIPSTIAPIIITSKFPSLYILGDIGFYGPDLKQMVGTFKHDVMFNDNKIALLGDNFYPNGIVEKNDKQWYNYNNVFGDISNRNIYAIMGNHDYHGNPMLQIKQNCFSNNDFFFKQSFHNVDIFFLDTIILYKGHCGIDEEKIKNIHNKPYNELKEDQLNWLKAGLLESNKSNRRKIVFGHYPIISNGIYTHSMKLLYNTLLPIFQEYNVDAYVSGHEHNIQYLKRKISDSYTFHQFIIGSSSQYRTNEYRNINHNDMFDNSNHYFLQFYENENNLFFEFKNKFGIIKHTFNL